MMIKVRNYNQIIDIKDMFSRKRNFCRVLISMKEVQQSRLSVSKVAQRIVHHINKWIILKTLQVVQVFMTVNVPMTIIIIKIRKV